MPLPPLPKQLGDLLPLNDKIQTQPVQATKSAKKRARTGTEPNKVDTQSQTKSAQQAEASVVSAPTPSSTRQAPVAALLSSSTKYETAATVAAKAAAAPSAQAAAPMPAANSPAKRRSRRASSKNDGQKNTANDGSRMFVLDTNVLMHDPSSLFRFEEHDIYLPMITLEELDNNKKGMSEVARNARQVSRTLDALVADATDLLSSGIPLSRLGNREAAGRLFFQTREKIEPVEGLPQGKADNQILSVVHTLQKNLPKQQVVLVSKDINMRVKAHTLGLPAEDYFNDQVLEDRDLLYSGLRALPEDFWEQHGKNVESWQDKNTGMSYYRISGPLCDSFLVNSFIYLEPSNGETAFYAQVKEVNGKTALVHTLRDYSHEKHHVWGITARNREQNFALNLLMNPDIDFVTLLGQAGTGKTLVALAAALTQVLDDKRYNEIIVTRATVPVGEDIGFLPGTEEEKMQPWMGAFDDNLEVLQKNDDSNGSSGEWSRAAAQELIRSRLKVKSMSFMRGRTFINKFVIIDEAQNLTPKQMKTLVTRAGPGTKIVCLGNIAQIDTPYLTEGSSGLTYVIERFKGWKNGGHITLARGERSRLADYASEVL